MNIIAHCETHPGYERSRNEDCYHLDSKLGLYIVCDGIGGEQAGEVASKMAITETTNFLKAHQEVLNQARNGALRDDRIHKLGVDAIRHACKKIHSSSIDDPSCANMGSTLVMVLDVGNRLLIGNVGDSRIYLLNDRGCIQITEDHTLVREFISKEIIHDESEGENIRHVLTRSLGKQATVEVDTLLIDVNPGDRLLLCTDGISEYISSSKQLDALLADGDCRDCARSLVARALDNGGADNCTAMVMDVMEDESMHSEEMQQNKLAFDAISNSQIFSGLSYTQTCRIKGMMDVINLSKGEMLIDKNERYSGFYLVINGGLQSRDELLISGDFFGHRALLTESLSDSRKVAVRNSNLLMLTRKSFDYFLSRYPRTGNRILKNIALTLI